MPLDPDDIAFAGQWVRVKARFTRLGVGQTFERQRPIDVDAEALGGFKAHADAAAGKYKTRLLLRQRRVQTQASALDEGKRV